MLIKMFHLTYQMAEWAFVKFLQFRFCGWETHSSSERGIRDPLTSHGWKVFAVREEGAKLNLNPSWLPVRKLSVSFGQISLLTAAQHNTFSVSFPHLIFEYFKIPNNLLSIDFLSPVLFSASSNSLVCRMEEKNTQESTSRELQPISNEVRSKGSSSR